MRNMWNILCEIPYDIIILYDYHDHIGKVRNKPEFFLHFINIAKLFKRSIILYTNLSQYLVRLLLAWMIYVSEVTIHAILIFSIQSFNMFAIYTLQLIYIFVPTFVSNFATIIMTAVSYYSGSNVSKSFFIMYVIYS